MSLNLERLHRFAVEAPASALDDLHLRLKSFRGPTEPVNPGWRYGVNGAYLADLVAYWREGFDWRAAERRLNERDHYWAELDCGEARPVKVHLIVQPSARTDAPVVLLTPGWPSSLLEFHDLIDHLAAPERYGGRMDEGVHVVAAELPGFGLSQPPVAPMSHRQMASLWRQLMVQVLEVPRFIAHGSDWGAVVSSWLALDHPGCVAGLHLSMLGLRPSLDKSGQPLSPEEGAWIGLTKRRLDADGGYREQQATRPTTLAVGLADSPAALAAWLIDKYHGWSGASPDEPPPFDRDALLTSASLYWLLGDLPAANWIYWADRHAGDIALGVGQRIETPTGFAFFEGGFFPVPPRAWAERAYNVVSWEVHPQGGHFAAWRDPGPLADSLLAFANARP